MLKSMLPISTLVGVFFAVPMAMDESPRTLQSALDDTVRALDVLRGLESAGARHVDPDVLRAASEASAADPTQRLAQLDRLHAELDRLQSHLEVLRSGATPAYSPLPFSSTTTVQPVPTVGLGSGELGRLIEAGRRAAIDSIEVEPTVVRRTPLPTNNLEPRGPASSTTGNESAPNTQPAATNPAPAPAPLDASLVFARARAAYFAGQYERALGDFQAGPDDARHRYWRARCLEQLERRDEALSLYDSVISDADAGDLVERARSDADFLRWKIKYETSTQSS